MGDSEKSIEAYEESLSIAKALAEAQPQDRKLLRTLASRWHSAGAAYYFAGVYDKALEYYEESIVLKAALLETDPNNVGLQQQQATTYNSLGLGFQEFFKFLAG